MKIFKIIATIVCAFGIPGSIVFSVFIARWYHFEAGETLALTCAVISLVVMFGLAISLMWKDDF